MDIDQAIQRKENAELAGSVQALQTENKKLRQELRIVSDQLQNSVQAESTTQRKHGNTTSTEEYSIRQQRRLKKQRTLTCEASLAWLEDEVHRAVKVEVKNLKSGEVETISLDSSVTGQVEEVTQHDLDVINMILYIKDRYGISGQAYHQMAQVCRTMPRHYKLKDRVRELNHLWDIRPTPNGTCGVQQTLKDRLLRRFEHHLSISAEDTPFRQSKVLRVKLSGDGTNIGKH